MVLISSHIAVIQHDCKTYIRGVVSLITGIHLAVGVQRLQSNLWKASNHHPAKIWIKSWVESTQLNAFKREIRDDQEKALNGVVKKLKASDKLVFKKKSMK